MRIIPAIDIIDGQCVRLTRGDYASKKVYNADPLEVAKSYEAAGITCLHLVDLDGARDRRIVNWPVLEKIARNTGLQIDFGGGINSTEDLSIAFEAGARQVTGGSVAARNQELFLEWLTTFGPEKIILGADARNGQIATDGWRRSTAIDLVDFVAGYRQQGIEYAICTDIARDGAFSGPAMELYRTIIARSPGLKLVASGGMTTMTDIRDLEPLGVDGVIIGKAIYENRITLAELSELC
ncbi:MAG: 1-(5-phosphoribosyl)-5-[(5-phosphoribosylamino)methylideneamino]imidazole-4-carboxamide isomerase [Candidatus Neomarinimicrobiota bacterium]